MAKDIGVVVEIEERYEQTIHRPIGCRKAKSLESWDRFMKKNLKYAAEAAEAQKR